MNNNYKIKNHHWAPYQCMLKTVETIAAQKSLVVEIGPGHIPFLFASEFVEWQLSPNLVGKTVHYLDINKDRLPYEDKSVDFLYCRHTLEDLYNPFWACQEMSRIAKSGYIETPSPVAEFCRGVDGGSPSYRGYVHHRYLIWADKDMLIFLPKYPIIEHFNFVDTENNIAEALNSSPLFWNTYFFWHDSISFHPLQHDKDFKIQLNYTEKILEGLQRSIENNLEIALKYGFDSPDLKFRR